MSDKRMFIFGIITEIVSISCLLRYWQYGFDLNIFEMNYGDEPYKYLNCVSILLIISGLLFIYIAKNPKCDI